MSGFAQIVAFQLKVLSADLTVTSGTTGTTLTATNLSVTLGPGTWLVRCVGSVRAASATPDVKLDFAYSGATAVQELTASGTINGTYVHYQGSASNNYFPLSTNGPVTIDLNDVGGFEVSATVTVAASGTVTLRFAQNTSSADALILGAGSYMLAIPATAAA